jgi:hypothetical protein
VASFTKDEEEFNTLFGNLNTVLDKNGDLFLLSLSHFPLLHPKRRGNYYSIFNSLRENKEHNKLTTVWLQFIVGKITNPKC